jgi:hypothetical protein
MTGIDFRGEAMAGQAGWYPAPNEAGMVRYWNGEVWTDHRQPMPVETRDEEPIVAASLTEPQSDASGVVVSSPALSNSTSPSPDATVSEPTSELSATELAMIEFERQFEKQSAEEFAHANSAPQSSLVESAPAPVSPQSRFAPQPTFAPPAPDLPVEAPAIDNPPISSVADMWSSVADQDVVVVPETSRAGSAAPGPASALPFALSPEPSSAGTAPAAAPRSRSIAPAKKKRSSGGALGMMIGAIVIIIGLGIFGYLAYQSNPQPGEAIATGIVTDLGASTASSGGSTCAPVARFAVLGKSYTAQTSVAVSSCPLSLGQTVSVIYDKTAPSTSGRIQVASPFSNLVGLVPLTGIIVFIASLIVFMRGRSKAAPIS